MATTQPIQSVTVSLRAGVSEATLPNNVKMKAGISYAISLEDYSKLSRGARESVVAEPTFNTSPFVVPLWNAAGFVLDLDTINNYSSLALLNADTQAVKDFALGEVVRGFNDNAFKLVLVDAGSTAIAAGDVVVWGGDAGSLAAQKAFKGLSTVTGDYSDVTDDGAALEFAGAAIGTITAGNYGWIQVAGTAIAKVDAGVDAGEPVYVSTTDETLAAGASNPTQVITLTSFTGTDSFTITFAGQTTAPIVRGTNAAAADVKTALAALSTLDAADITVTGTTDEGPYTVAFDEGGAYEGIAAPLFTITGTGCTGVSVTTVVGGVAPDSVGTALTAADTGTALVAIRSDLARVLRSRERDIFRNPRN